MIQQVKVPSMAACGRHLCRRPLAKSLADTPEAANAMIVAWKQALADVLWCASLGHAAAQLHPSTFYCAITGRNTCLCAGAHTGIASARGARRVVWMQTARVDKQWATRYVALAQSIDSPRWRIPIGCVSSWGEVYKGDLGPDCVVLPWAHGATL